MFVRWKSRPNRRCWAEPGERHLVAELAECRRVDGRPRQQILAYLGTVAESDINLPRHLSLVAFWSRVDRVLGEIIFDGTLRDELAAAIERRVPRPPVEAVAQTQFEFEAWLEEGVHVVRLPRPILECSSPQETASEQEWTVAYGRAELERLATDPPADDEGLPF